MSAAQRQLLDTCMSIAKATECILVRKDLYLRMAADVYTTPRTSEEMDLLADEAEAMISRMEGHGH